MQTESASNANLLHFPDRLRELIKYDPETGLFRWAMSRNADRVVCGDICGSLDKKAGYYKLHILGRQYMAHRVAFVLMTGRIPYMVDHVNRDGTDNRWMNLREADDHSNQHNALWPKGKTGIKNVGYDNSEKRKKRFVVRFRINGRLKNCGRYETLDEAAEIARVLRRLYHGEFAREQ